MGLGQIIFAFLVSFPAQTSTDTLRQAVQRAWLQLRKEAPIIACKTEAYLDSENSWYFQYNIPRNDGDAEKWLEETITWHEDRKPLHEREKEFQTLWWKADAGHYTYTLHVAPDVEIGKWQFL